MKKEKGNRSKTEPAPEALRYDLDQFSSSWTKEEADEFDAALKQQRKVDPKDWNESSG